VWHGLLCVCLKAAWHILVSGCAVMCAGLAVRSRQRSRFAGFASFASVFHEQRNAANTPRLLFCKERSSITQRKFPRDFLPTSEVCQRAKAVSVSFSTNLIYKTKRSEDVFVLPTTNEYGEKGSFG